MNPTFVAALLHGLLLIGALGAQHLPLSQIGLGYTTLTGQGSSGDNHLRGLSLAGSFFTGDDWGACIGYDAVLIQSGERDGASINPSDYESRLGYDAVVGPGYRLRLSRSFSTVWAAGAHLGVIALTEGEYPVDPLGLLTLGLGASISFQVFFDDHFGLSASLLAGYDPWSVVWLGEAGSYETGLVFTPSLGFVFQ